MMACELCDVCESECRMAASCFFGQRKFTRRSMHKRRRRRRRKNKHNEREIRMKRNQKKNTSSPNRLAYSQCVHLTNSPFVGRRECECVRPENVFHLRYIIHLESIAIQNIQSNEIYICPLNWSNLYSNSGACWRWSFFDGCGLASMWKYVFATIGMPESCHPGAHRNSEEEGEREQNTVSLCGRTDESV